MKPKKTVGQGRKVAGVRIASLRIGSLRIAGLWIARLNASDVEVVPFPKPARIAVFSTAG
jgi:hypothetical protein